jgi:hypothetical protein
MKNQNFVRLEKQGHDIALSLEAQGYRCVKKYNQLLWLIQPPTPGSQLYGLVYLTPPINDWVIIPDVMSDEKLKLAAFLNQRLQRSSGR